MKTVRSLIPLGIILALAGLACNTLIPTASPLNDSPSTLLPLTPQFDQSGLPLTEVDVPRITPADAKAAFDAGLAVILDVRDLSSFSQKHISGAVLVPLNDIELNPIGIPYPQDQWIITYCT